jgi:2-C-methyl-D-erythritol 4-phosphate cytidylyltransferase
MERPPVVVILVGAGMGRRLGGDQAKAFRAVGERTILEVAASTAAAAPGVRSLVAVVPPGREDAARAILSDLSVELDIVAGGTTRQDSVRTGLAVLPEGDVIVLVHDAARPFATAALFARVIEAVDGEVDAVAPVVPVTDTVVRVRAGVVASVEPRDELSFAQTPQGFRAAALREAHAKADAAGFSFTDDASLARWAGFEVRAVEGEIGNVKITTSSDLVDARRRAGGTA